MAAPEGDQVTGLSELSLAGRLRAVLNVLNEAGMEAFDSPGVLALQRDWVDPSIEFTIRAGTPIDGSYRGIDAYLKASQEWFSMWREIRLDVERLEEDEDTVIALVRYSARGRASGVETEASFGWMLRHRDEKLVRFEILDSFEAALASSRA